MRSMRFSMESLRGTPNGNATHTQHGDSCCEAVAGTAPNLALYIEHRLPLAEIPEYAQPPSHLLIFVVKTTESCQAVIPLEEGKTKGLILDHSPAKTLEINKRKTTSAVSPTEQKTRQFRRNLQEGTKHLEYWWTWSAIGESTPPLK